MCPQEETKGDRFSKELEEESGIQQKAQTVWERSFSLVRMEESDQMWMDELQEGQWLGTDMATVMAECLNCGFLFPSFRDLLTQDSFL